jgi:hypothetical protein
MHAAAASAVATPSPSAVSRLGRELTGFPATLLATLIAYVFWKCRGNIADPDIWWHLKNAEYMVRNLAFPRFDMYSFTVRGDPWMAHEWLPELIYYGAYRVGGWIGIFALFAGLGAALFGGVFLLCRRENSDPLAAFLASLLGVLLATVGLGPRMQTFGWLCFLGVYAILVDFRSTRNTRKLWLIPPLFLLWINCHAGWLLGLAMLALFVGAGFLQADIGSIAASPWTRHELGKLLQVGACSCLALFVNPFGYHLVFYPFDAIFFQKLNIQFIDEWQPVNFQNGRGGLVLIVLAATLIAALLGRRKWRAHEVLLAIFALFCGLQHVRLLLMAGIILPPIFAGQIGSISSYDPAIQRRGLNAALTCIALAFVLSTLRTPAYVRENFANHYPAAAIAYLRQHPLEGRMLNHYEWGGYLEWSAPELPVFIDSRTDIFERRGVLRDYLQAMTLDNSHEILDRYSISYLLIPGDFALSYHLRHTTGWQEIYSDKTASIFRRSVAPSVKP